VAKNRFWKLKQSGVKRHPHVAHVDFSAAGERSLDRDASTLKIILEIVMFLDIDGQGREPKAANPRENANAER